MRLEIEAADLDAIRREIEAAAKTAEHTTAVQVAKDTEPYTPMRTGSLKNRTQVKENTVVYPGPYARFLYYGKKMIDPDTRSPFARKGITKVLTNEDLVFSKASHKLAQAHWFEASKAANKEKWVRVMSKSINQNLK